MASKNFFASISNKLHQLWRNAIAQKHKEVQTKLELYKFDVDILKIFCSCLQEWDYSAVEQTKESLRSMINHLKLIWIEEYNNFETLPKHIQDFEPLTFRLEEKIQQSKPHIQQWCQILVRSSSSMECKTSTDTTTFLFYYSNRLYFISTLSSYRAAKSVPLKNQIDLLKDMLRFLYYSLQNFVKCIDSKELVEYRNFVHSFSNNAVCLICMCWAKEAKDETATEMNICLVDMLHKIKPRAADVIGLYFAFLKSNNLVQPPQNTPASFVDFFYEHTILKDDFIILRPRFIFLFTFLTDAPQQNSEEEGRIRSQICTLFREDAYLLLPISEMKEDVSNNKMLLTDFMTKIEILTTKIIQLYCTPSDSWNRLEAGKMNNIYFASLEREFSKIVDHESGEHYPIYEKELGFLRLFIQCFETWDDSDEETRVRLSAMLTSLQSIWGQEYDMGLLSNRLIAIRKRRNVDWHPLDLELKEKIQMSKQEINAWLGSLSCFSFQCRPSRSNKILKFLDNILYYMSDIGAYKDVALKKQIEILKEKLSLVKNLLKLATGCAYSKNLEEFNMLAQVFANNAACLIYLYWAKEANFEIPLETNLILSDMLQKIKPDTPDVARMYIGTLKAICLQPYDFLLLEQTAMSFVDYFFEDLVTPWKNHFQILRDEVLFHLTFVHYHHYTANAEEIICSQLDILFSDDVYNLLPFHDINEDIFKKKVGLSDFMMNIETKNAKIRRLYCKFPDSLVDNFPRIIGQGFLDCLIQKLRKLIERMIRDQKFVPFTKYKIAMIEEELIYLIPIFNQIMELKDQNDAWFEVVNVVYLTEHIISLCCIFYHLILHYIPFLSDVADRIKVVKTKLEMIEKCSIARCLPHPTGLKSTPLLQQDWTSEIHEIVGFEADEKIIIDNITRGTQLLDIVSIVGMGGLGKTTLAKKVYSCSSVKSHFNIFAFTYVSQDHDKRRLLLDILRDIGGIDAKSSMTADDLAQILKKCLSRKRYFIVLDDIWHIKAWDEVRSSFPDNQNGSRVMFTTRSLEVAKRGQINCSPHHLRFLTEDESWKLLQKKVLYNDMPPNISSVAKVISKKCGGLPLAIIVIAGLLARTETSLWIEISKRVSSYLFDEGCMNILELSYKHLPEYLKPCLLYLGAFPEDSSYRVNDVTLLWIAEGFIQESKTKSLNDVAKEYLYELVDRNLIIVDKMTIGEIRTFRVHDLIHDLCQKKCLDSNFFQLVHGTATSSFPAPLIYNYYRVSVQKPCDIADDNKLSLASTRSLLCFLWKFYISERALFPLRKLRFAQVLDLKGISLEQSDFEQLTSLIDLRHIEVQIRYIQSIPLSISNLCNLQSLIFRGIQPIRLPETLWRMKSLRHVKARNCHLNFSDGYEPNAHPQLDKVVSFSRPYLSTGKHVEWLLQRLPVVQKLSCILNIKSIDSIEERVETFDFHSKLQSLKLHIDNVGRNCLCLINFPSTLIKLTLEKYTLSSTAISAIMKLQCLRILKLRDVSFPEPIWEMEDVTFPNLKYFELGSSNLELWNANIDSFPCLVELLLDSFPLKELPPCFGEISSLKKITLRSSPKLKSSALSVQEEQMDFGNKIEFVGL